MDIPIKYFSLYNRHHHKNILNKKFKIIVLSDTNIWINEYLKELVYYFLDAGHKVLWLNNTKNVPKGDFCFYLGFSKIVEKFHLKKYKHNLVVHESNLPEGKGWSPLTWQVLEGKNIITVSLFEADEKVDNGKIYIQEKLKLSNLELVDELREKQAKTTLKLCKKIVNNFPDIINKARVQKGKETYYNRRSPEDSKIDFHQSFKSQFNLLRTVDNIYYPAFFINKEIKYIIKIYKED